LKKQKHAYATLCEILKIDDITKEHLVSALDKTIEIQEFIRNQVYISRKKDFDNPFCQATYRNMAEMTAAIGNIDDNSFVKQVQDETKDFKKLIEEIKKRI
jgi:DNA polymerase III alpha subunit (gram-positive type)